MMAVRANVTDRALRYRANNAMPDHRRICAFCGARGRLDVGHVNGNESDDSPDNLTWTCRPCNVVAGNTLRNAGLGRKTHQYNPTKTGGAASVGEWMQAVGAITPRVDRGDRGLASSMSVSDAVAMIRATPHHKRSQFAAELNKHKRARRRGENPGLFAPGGVFGSRERVYDLEAAREQAREQRRSKPEVKARYRGYTIYKTPDGEFFSSLDRDSWYGGLAAVKRSIDDYFKGRENPTYTLLKNKRVVLRTQNPAKFEKCVREVKAKGRDVDAYAVCTAAGTRRNLPVPLGLWDIAQLQGAEQAIRKAALGRKRGNPLNPEDAAREGYEMFHGRPATGATTYDKALHYHSNLWEVGELIKIWVRPANGASDVDLEGFEGKNGQTCQLSANEKRTQLYIEGGDQSVDLAQFEIGKPYHDFENLGEVVKIWYYTIKDHLGDEGGEATYHHKLGEEKSYRFGKLRGRNVPRPILEYDTLNKSLRLVGGEYLIEAEGIKN